MNAILRFLELLIDTIIANSALTRTEAIDLLQTQTNGVSNAGGTDWFDELFNIYEMIGVINNATWSAWRNEIINEGAAAPKSLASHIVAKLQENLAMAEINNALRFKRQEDSVVEMTADIQTAVAHKDLQTDPAVIDALKKGIAQMREERDGLRQRLGI